MGKLLTLQYVTGRVFFAIALNGILLVFKTKEVVLLFVFVVTVREEKAKTFTEKEKPKAG